MNDSAIRTMPNDTVSEETVISAILTNGAEAMDLCDHLTTEHFYNRSNRILYETLLELHEEGKVLEVQSVISRLKDAGRLEEVGGIFRINQIASAFMTTANLPHYCEALNDKLMLRRVIETSTRAIQMAHERQDDPKAVLEQVEVEALALRDGARVAQDKNELEDACNEAESEIEVRENTKRGHIEMPTGLAAWDKAFNGIMDERSYLVAGRPGLGKTAMVEMFSTHIARQNRPVLWVSLDMSRKRLIERMACREAGVSYAKWLKFYTSKEESQAIREAINGLRKLPLHIWSPATATAQQIRGIIRRSARRGVKLWILDYFSKLNVSGGREKRSESFAEASLVLHQAIKETKVPGLILVQLNRESEKEKLSLRHLSETSQLEKDSDCICMMDCDDMKESPREVTLAIEKNRDGALGYEKVRFIGGTMSFEDIEEEVP